ncbi:MAG: hypothetical protein DWQ47_02500 [Acidobacteria bacterium]|nr:MAG: hypothetical protein DWQ32_06050 [Acidobacteriota bacterium]REK01285.1 MAG: hypothetical protein DWQ38_02485 [Acidobacteriota bacterium]REK14241.1 MAG: hypothetical protein DWQ43_11740 [Acidobacteriota bacterium]REK44956.1 MAG: hypothetical protein DWQ47_02500 [Acidobacteriota bacterium]
MKSLPKVLISMLALLAASAFPYELQRLPDKGTPVKWASKKITLSVSSSLIEISPAVRGDWKPLESIQRAALAWSSASGIEISLEESDAQSISPHGRKGDGVSLITIAQTPENLILFTGKNVSRPAFTRIFFNGKGRIIEADVVLNPYHPISTDGIFGAFDLESTVVHELGHVLGLGHSDVLGASMNEVSARNGLYTIPFTTYRTLSADDVAGIRALYPEFSREEGCCRTIAGRMTGDLPDAGEFVVWAEDLAEGSVIASVRRSANGEFRLEGIPEGDYRLFARSASGTSGAFDLGIISTEVGEDKAFEIDPEPFDARAGFVQAGFNGQLSEVSVPVNAGRVFRLFVGGAGTLDHPRLEISSPKIAVEEGSLEVLDYGKDSIVLSFVAEVGDAVSTGDYTIRLYDGDKLIDCLVGAISVETEVNPWVHRDL